MFSKNHKILQICAKIVDGPIFTSFVNPGFKGGIPPNSSLIHNIHDQDIKDAPTIEQVVAKMFKEFHVEDFDYVEMIAHNNTYFDQLILLKELNGVVPQQIKFWDSLPWLRKNYPNMKSFRLGDVHEVMFGKPIENAHRADADVLALENIYKEWIAPKRDLLKELDDLENEETIVDECLTCIRYVGPWRANLMCEKGHFDSVSGLRNFAYGILKTGDKRGFDRWLRDKIKMKDITQRAFIVSHVLDIPPWASDIQEYLLMSTVEPECWNDIDYYVKYRYKLQKEAPNQCAFGRGLMNINSE